MVMGSRNSVNFGSGFTISHILSLCPNKAINPRIQKDWILDILTGYLITCGDRNICNQSNHTSHHTRGVTGN